MAAVVNQNFTKHLGDDIVIQFEIGDVTTLTGFTLRWVLCADDPEENPNSTILMDKENSGTSPQIYIIDNYAFVEIPSSDTDSGSGFGAGSYYHELHGLDENSDGGVLATGTGTFLPTRIGR